MTEQISVGALRFRTGTIISILVLVILTGLANIMDFFGITDFDPWVVAGYRIIFPLILAIEFGAIQFLKKRDSKSKAGKIALYALIGGIIVIGLSLLELVPGVTFPMWLNQIIGWANIVVIGGAILALFI